jgi:hypothetical protein
MKKAVLMSLVILLLSVAVVFAQSEQAAVKSAEEEMTVQKPQTAQKVSDVRRVVVTRDLIQMKNLEKVENVKYDKKGGIIVPNASKGIKITSQNKNVAEIKQAKGKGKILKNTQQKPLKAQKDRSQAVRAVEKKSQ